MNIQIPSSLSFLNPIIQDDLIRIGNTFDGGYVLPSNTLKHIDGVISLGINHDWSLEEALIAKSPNLVIHAYDHTIDIGKFRRAFKSEIWRFVLFRSNLQNLQKKWQTFSGYKSFFRGSVKHFRSRVYNRKLESNDSTFDEIFGAMPINCKSLFLKIDIEGGEYRVLNQLHSHLTRVDLIAIEFHDIEPFRDHFIKHMHTLLEQFTVIHTHCNNCGGVAADGIPDVLEITLLKTNKLSSPNNFRNNLPVPTLDNPNRPELPDFRFSFQ